MEAKSVAVGAGKTREAEAEVPKIAESGPVDVADDVPSPDEDDLDDLDDMLDDFATVNIDTKRAEQPTAPPATSRPWQDAIATENGTDDKILEDVLSSDDFAKQLQAGMADLINELEKNPEMQSQFDNVFEQISAAAGEAESIQGPATTKTPQRPTSSSSRTPAPDPLADGSFQESIKRTMERMQASEQQAAAAASESSTDDFLAEMMKQLGEGNMEGGDNEEEFSKMLMGMMEQLTNKEILYEPMKELNDKFPNWFEKNREKTPADELKRYEEQQALVKEIVAKFEEKTYADSNTGDREYIVDRMQKMQAAGSPPPDLVGEMPSAQEAFNADENCNPQ